MDTITITPAEYLAHLLSVTAPLRVNRKPEGVQWSDDPLHRTAYQRDPELYVLLALVDGTTEQQRARVLFSLLKYSWVDLASE